MKSLADARIRRSILDRIARLDPSEKRRWGRMSSHQAIVHLSDSFRGVMGEKQVSSATGVLQRTLMKWGALYVPAPWPKGIPTRPEMKQGAGGTLPVEFERDRSELVTLIGRFCRRAEWSSHPLFGEMRASEWMRWGYLHVDHHLRQFGV